MQYEGQICRPPMERASYMLPVAVGCSYNACMFCGLFKHLSYRELPREQIEAELQRVHAAGGNPKTVFLGDGNAFGLKTEQLLWILERIHHYFPGCEAVNMDATVTNISHKSDEELKALYDAGVRNLYLGIESGLDDVLAFMKKDHNLQQAYEQIGRMQKAGLIFNAHIARSGGQVICPSNRDNLSKEEAQFLFDITSVIPPSYRAVAEAKFGMKINDNAKGCVFEADGVQLIQLIDFGSSKGQQDVVR